MEDIKGLTDEIVELKRDFEALRDLNGKFAEQIQEANRRAEAILKEAIAEMEKIRKAGPAFPHYDIASNYLRRKGALITQP